MIFPSQMYYITLDHTETFLTLPTEANVSAKPLELHIYKNRKETGSDNDSLQKLLIIPGPIFLASYPRSNINPDPKISPFSSSEVFTYKK